MNGTQREAALEERKSLDRITEAMATLEELYEYVPAAAYEMFQEGLREIIDATQWQNKPALIRRILPILLEDQLAQDERKGAEFSKKPLTAREMAITTMKTLNAFMKAGVMSDRTRMTTLELKEAIAREYFAAKGEKHAEATSS